MSRTYPEQPTQCTLRLFSAPGRQTFRPSDSFQLLSSYPQFRMANKFFPTIENVKRSSRFSFFPFLKYSLKITPSAFFPAKMRNESLCHRGILTGHSSCGAENKGGSWGVYYPPLRRIIKS